MTSLVKITTYKDEGNDNIKEDVEEVEFLEDLRKDPNPNETFIKEMVKEKMNSNYVKIVAEFEGYTATFTQSYKEPENKSDDNWDGCSY